MNTKYAKILVLKFHVKVVVQTVQYGLNLIYVNKFNIKCSKNPLSKSGVSEGKIPLERPRCRWEDILKQVLQKPSEDVDLIHLTEDRVQRQALVNSYETLGST
jgi:hypothetical protein